MGVAVNSQCTECRTRKKNQIQKCINGEKAGQGTKYSQKAYMVICYEKWDSYREKYVCGSPKMVKKSAPKKGRLKILYGPDSWSKCHDKYPTAF